MKIAELLMMSVVVAGLSGGALAADVSTTYKVTVKNGESEESFFLEDGKPVEITADSPKDGMMFVQWTTDDNVDFHEADNCHTTFTMPANDVTVTAVYKTILITGLSNEGYPYTGEPITPEVRVELDGTDMVLVYGQDYDVSFSANVNPGTAMVTVNMLKKEGRQTAKFNILPTNPPAALSLWKDGGEFQNDRAAAYNGFLADGDGVLMGTIGVKVGKPNKRTGVSKMTVTLQLVGKKKTIIKGMTSDGTFSSSVGGVGALDIKLGGNSLSGTLGGYVLDGSRGLFAAKDADAKQRAGAALRRWQRSYVAAWHNGGAGGWSTISATVKAKGKTKVSGTLGDGTKVSVSTQLLVGDGNCAVPVCWSKKGASVSCVLWLCEDGTVVCAELPKRMAIAAPAGSGMGGALNVDKDAMAASFPGLDRELSFPGGTLVKLKLKYQAKTGVFGGSFKVFVGDGRRVKPVPVKVAGVVIEGRSFGTAFVKKVGNWWVCDSE